MTANTLTPEALQAIDSMIFLLVVIGMIPFLAALAGALIQIITILTSNPRS